MATPNKNLKAIFEYLGLTNLTVSKALNLDPSLVSRYLSGHRQLKAASPQMDAIADFILERGRRVQDVEWLKQQFAAAGFQTDISTVYRLKQNLILWLATDGDTLRRNLGTSLPGGIANAALLTKKPERARVSVQDNDTKTGCLEIVFALRPALAELPKGTTVGVFLSNDRLSTAVNEDVAALFLEMISANDLRLNMVVCVSGDTQAMSKLLDNYMGALISGHVRLSVVHGMTQTVTSSMHILVQSDYAMLVTETAGASAPPIATVIRNTDFIREMQDSFDIATRYAQPVLNIYNDNFSRNILEILYMEFCTPGALDVVKDNINPMYMTEEAYNRVLRTHGHSEPEYAWRSAEFTRFKSGMDETLRDGSVFREILSLSRLNQIVRDGFCRMPGLYFMRKGFVHLDAQGCADILNGYIRYLEAFPNFHLLILDDITLLHSDNCWQLKQNHHLAINHWSGPEPVMIHSDQLMLLREFQAHFDKLWAQGAGAVGSRANVISILPDVAVKLQEHKGDLK